MIGQVVNVQLAILTGIFSINVLNGPLSAITSAQGAAYAVFKTIDRKPPIDSSSREGLKDVDLKGEISFKNVSFSYPSRPEIQVLKEFSVNIKPGQKVALVGMSGVSALRLIHAIRNFSDR